jgi:large subunit ribosomal protein L7/L12
MAETTITREQVIEFLSGLTVVELNALTKELEAKWGVTAAAPVAVAAVAAGPAPAAEAAQVEEKTEFDVVLKEVPAEKRVPVIKEIRTVVSGLGLKEAKELVESAPKTIREAVSKEEAQKIKEKLEAAGAVIEIK